MEQKPLFEVCGTSKCDRPPEYCFTWPGHDEQLACAECAKRAKRIAESMGMHLQIKLLIRVG